MEYSFERNRIVGGIGADDGYWRGLEEGEFRLPRCASCKRWFWPATFRCGQCGSWEFEWVAVEPRGTVYAWTRARLPFERCIERAEDLPFVTVLAEVPHAGNARVMGVLKGGERDLRIGAPVRGEILPPTAKAKGYASIVWAIGDSAGEG
jgi:uncharacterized OB-fold protein